MPGLRSESLALPSQRLLQRLQHPCPCGPVRCWSWHPGALAGHAGAGRVLPRGGSSSASCLQTLLPRHGSRSPRCAERPYKSKVCGITDNECLLISHKFSAKCTITELIMQCRT